MLTRLFASLEYIRVLLIGRLTGISYVVKYLRNPNPLIVRKVLKQWGAKIGAGSSIKNSVFIDNSWEDKNSTGDFSNLTIGENCYIGDSVFLDLANPVEIKDNSIVSANVSIITHADCNRSAFLSKVYPRVDGKVIIDKSSWIGAGCTLLPGSLVAENSVLAAGSVLNSSTEPRTLYGGTPAKFIKSISN